jgi:hypothetical protein
VVSVAAGVEVEGAAVVAGLEGERSRADVPVERIDTVGDDMPIDLRERIERALAGRYDPVRLAGRERRRFDSLDIAVALHTISG